MATWPANGSNVDVWDAALLAWLTDAVFNADGSLKSDGLTDISGLSVADGNIIVGDGTNWVAESGDTARTSLGLGTGDTPQFYGLSLSEAVGNSSIRLTTDNSQIEYGSAVSGANHGAGFRLRGAEFVGGGTAEMWFGGIRADATDPGSFFKMYYRDATTGGATTVVHVTKDLNVGIGNVTPAEKLHVVGKIRANTAFNLNGTDGVTNTAAGVITDIDISGGIVTSVTKSEITHQTVFNFPASSMIGDNDAQLVAGDAAAAPTTHKGRPVLAFDDTDEEAAITPCMAMPQGVNRYGTTLYATLSFYMATDNTNDVAMDVFVEAVTPNADTLDLEAATSWSAANSGTVSLSGSTAGDLRTLTITLTNKDSVAAGDLVRFGVRRDCDSGNDDASGDLYLANMEIWEA